MLTGTLRLTNAASYNVPNPRVELGIPTRNNQRTIWDTLSGFANQTHPPDRVHIVDASDDWTPYIVDLFRQQIDLPYVLDVEHQTEGTGVGAARERIYEQFEGDILACFDTNAVPESEWLEKHIQTHKRHPSIDVVSGVSDNRQPGIVETPHDRGFLVQNNCSIKRQSLDQVNGWDQQFDRGEDWDLSIRLWRSGAKSYVRNDINREPLRNEGVDKRLQTRLGRPSSIRFLRKYGRWYAKFHPAHVLGDVASIFSTVTGILVLPLMWISGIMSLLLLAIPLLGALGYTIIQSQVRTSGGFEIEFVLRSAPEFFLLGYTAVRELLFGPRTGWNYGGLG